MFSGDLLAYLLRALERGDMDDFEHQLALRSGQRDELLDLVDLALAVRGPATPDAATIAATAGLPAFQPRAWPEVLRDARHAQGIKRPRLVRDLADRLGITTAEGRERIRERYHEVETGQLDPRHVADSVLDALGDLLGGLSDVLTTTRLNPPSPLRPKMAFLRDGFDDADSDQTVHAMALSVPTELTPEERRVDELFGA